MACARASTQGHTDTVTQTTVTLTPTIEHDLVRGIPCSLSGGSHLPHNYGVLRVQFRLTQAVNHHMPVLLAQWEESRLQAPPLQQVAQRRVSAEGREEEEE